MTTTERALRNDDAERALIGQVLVSPAALSSAGHLRPSHFAVPALRRVWQSMLELDEAGTPLDLVTLKTDLERRGELQAAGGAVFIGSLTDGVPRASNVEAWADAIRDAALRRALVASGERMAALARSADVALAALEEGLTLLMDTAQASAGTMDLNVVGAVKEGVRDLETSSRGEGAGWRTGLADLDRQVGRLRPGHLVVVGGRTGQGKSTLLMNVGEDIARQGGKVLLVSAEMSRVEVTRRRLCAEARVPATHFEGAGVTPTDSDWRNIARAEVALAGRIFVVDASAPTPIELRSKTRFMAAACGLDAVLVDYLQLLPPGPPPGRRSESREQEVARISRALKRLAMELRVVVIAAAQLNRAPEGRKDPRPRLHDLRESGSQEQDSDVVLLLHKADNRRHEIEINVAKHRSRGTGRAVVGFDGAVHRFEDLASPGSD